MTREEQIEQKAKELGQKYFPDEYNIWARPNYEAQFVESACKEMIEWADDHPINYDGKAMLHVLHKGAAIGRREMLDKACEWLENIFHDRSHHSGRGDAGEIVTYDFDSMQEFILKFRKAIEE